MMPAPDAPPLEHALLYARNGWGVFPVHAVVQARCTCGYERCSSAGKHPRTANPQSTGGTNPKAEGGQ